MPVQKKKLNNNYIAKVVKFFCENSQQKVAYISVVRFHIKTSQNKVQNTFLLEEKEIY